MGISYVELNLSVYQLPYRELLDYFKECMLRYGVRSSEINIEITESGNLVSLDRNNMLKRFQQYGFRFSLDDFGTGSSNLNRLLNEPYTNIKFDKMLLDCSEDNPRNLSYYENMLHMVKGMGFRVIQEGVETQEQRERVRDMGCDLIQGYYYSKPLPVAAFVDFMKEHQTTF